MKLVWTFFFVYTTFSGFVVFLLKHYEYAFSKASMYLFSREKDQRRCNILVC